MGQLQGAKGQAHPSSKALSQPVPRTGTLPGQPVILAKLLTVSDLKGREKGLSIYLPCKDAEKALPLLRNKRYDADTTTFLPV